MHCALSITGPLPFFLLCKLYISLTGAFISFSFSLFALFIFLFFLVSAFVCLTSN